MKLVVIEGIGKLDTVKKYLGDGYRVFATKGHVRDLPAKSLAVDVKNNFEPKYTILPDKLETVQNLKKAASVSDEVLLATDPDREGEAISWHVANILNIPEGAPVRIEFNEISKHAVQDALKNPRAINMDLVDAQQARRVLDRLVGYKMSPVLCKKIQNRLSAGRVQSVTLRMIVDREREIRNFKPEEYWLFASMLKAGDKSVKANLATKNKKKIKLTSEEEVNTVKSELDGKEYTVTLVKRSVTKSHPAPPFITSTMQQDAMNKLSMSLKQTSATAQTLYEGVDLPGEGKVALITYIRTDSTRVSEGAIESARQYVIEKYGVDYLPEKPNRYTSKKSAQDAHEAIRPISIERTPESLQGALKDGSINKLQFKLYKLIYERFLASQMCDATYNSVSVEITAGDYGFKVTGRTPLFDGFTKIYAPYQDAKKDDEEVNGLLPEMREGDKLSFVEYKCDQKFTKPPARYTEASLVKTMEEIGIGRPATYTPTVSLLFSREYTVKDGKNIVPTELGERVNDLLIKYFPNIMDVKFTAHMEEQLDDVAENHKEWQSVIRGFYDGFEEEIKAAMGDDYTLKEPDIETEYVCEKCGSPMVIRNGRNGRFLACKAYPKCKNTKQIDDDGKIVEATSLESDVECDKCGAKMVIKTGRFGKFLACPNYPKCKNTKAIEDPKAAEELPPCPLCGKPLHFVRARGSGFYGCTGYPECRFLSSAKPLKEKCPTCGAYLTERTGKGGVYKKCSNRECNYKTAPIDKGEEQQ